MRVSEQVLLSVLRQGGCIRSFWRRSARLAGIPSPVVPDGLVLETPGERGDTPLCYVDFVVVAKGLVCGEEWTQVIGTTEFGGVVWRLVPDAQISSRLSPQVNGERNEQ
ncbi:cytoplasmic protein [Salmonella enterica subsp. enterica serovar Morehead]|nr:cytoplasmic protein [Salmonella enterica subsp. enterica serovar Kottbus]EEM2539463.1 cytoplasmic protein [Salmonella enterica subsp. enterica serovar Morehead]EHN5888781.1 cytoplasmic protein [Salmonella enterica subsp. enterica serovar Newport]